MHLYRILTFFLLCLSFALHGQKVHLSKYTVEDGLPSDNIRDVEKDTFGFLWLATDGGLVRFDGQNFEAFSAELPSQYGKSLLATKKGIYYSHDAGISYFKPKLTNTAFSLILESNLQESESQVYYPNTLFQSLDTSIWISQPNGVIVKYKDGRIDKYELSKEDSTTKSDSKYTFLETQNGVLLAAAQTGKLYTYSPTENQFRLLLTNDRIEDIIEIDNVLWIAGNGLQRIQLSRNNLQVKKSQRLLSKKRNHNRHSKKMTQGTFTWQFMGRACSYLIKPQLL